MIRVINLTFQIRIKFTIYLARVNLSARLIIDSGYIRVPLSRMQKYLVKQIKPSP